MTLGFAVFAVLGWILAALSCGLYLGERGRRLDAQRREGVLPVGRVKKPIVSQGSGMAPEGMTPATASQDLKAARDKYVAECVAEGFSSKAAEEDWQRLLAKASTDQIAAWTE